MVSAVEVVDLSVCYGRGNRVLDKVCLEVSKGQIYGLLGPSGCGKTTLVSCLLSLVKPMPGSTVRLFGRDLSHKRDIGIPGPNVGKIFKPLMGESPPPICTYSPATRT